MTPKLRNAEMLPCHGVMVFKCGAPLHVIGENNFDSTLPLAHAVTTKESKKDLINTQAMFARGLVQALASDFIH